MDIKCEFCGNIINENDRKCPYCGAANSAVRRSADGTPKTIEELQRWYMDRNLPPYEVTRFFIGVDYRQPRAFGIYRDGGEFVVYKNKADGERAIRYRGSDEAYAVNELYLKLKSEILNQKEHNLNRRAGQASYGGNKKSRRIGSLLAPILFMTSAIWVMPLLFAGFFLDSKYKGAGEALIIAVVATVMLAVIFGVTRNRRRRDEDSRKGRSIIIRILVYALICAVMTCLLAVPIHNFKKTDYYSYDDRVYVHTRSHWYMYNYDDDDYYRVEDTYIPDALISNDSIYRVDNPATYWNSEVTLFESSNYYAETFSSDSDSDSGSDRDYDWDSGDGWDSGDTNWDSDW